MKMSEIFEDTVATWERERPDLDLRAMFTALRLLQLVNVAQRRLERLMAAHGLSLGEFDVLATLRRNGVDARLSPSVLAKVAMVTPGGMTSRLDRLEAAGHIVREVDPADRRASLVSLTPSGREVVDGALEDLVAAETNLFSVLSEGERDRVDRILDKVTASLDR
jgi:DNA-binding MarR family transcriptional regulator